MDDNYGERRKGERFPFREHITVEGTTRCISMDINEEGIFISSIQHFGKGEVIDLAIPIQDGSITVKGKVQFSQPGIGIGVVFLDLDDDQKAKIKDLVARISGRSS